jgi:tetratricopeptide (TPR) repeat protein
MAATGCSTLENGYKCRTGDPDTRIVACTALIQAGHDTPNNLSSIYTNRGNAYFLKGNHDLAAQDYNEAIHLSPNNPYAHLGRGVNLSYRGDYDHAIEDLNEAIRINPSSALAYLDRGSVYETRGVAYDKKDDYDHGIQDYNQAILDFNDAIRLEPNYASAYFRRGVAYDRLGMEHDDKNDYDHATLDLNDANRLSPNDAVTYRYRGLAYGQEGEYDRAIQDLNEAIRLDPKDSIAYLGRGVTHNHRGDYSRAVQDFDQAIRLDPKNSIVEDVRGRTYLFQSNLTAAVSDLEDSIKGAQSPHMAISTALDLHVAMKRLGRDDARQLAQLAATTDLSKWPGPMLNLDMGKTTAGEVMRAANNAGDARKKWHVCEANYLIAENAVLDNQRAAALEHLRAARDGCPKWDIDYVAALEELKRLSAPAAPSK